MRSTHSHPIRPQPSAWTAALALLLASGAGSAQAQGLVRPAPDALRQAQAPAAAATAGASDQWAAVPVPGMGLMRLPKPGAAASAPQAAGPKGMGTHWVTPTQALRVAPDQPAMPGAAQVASPLARTPSTDPTLHVRQQGSVQVLERRGQAPMLLGASPAAADAARAAAQGALPPGVQVVVLPPGAVTPDGPPAPLTLYRPATAAEAGEAVGRR